MSKGNDSDTRAFTHAHARPCPCRRGRRETYSPSTTGSLGKGRPGPEGNRGRTQTVPRILYTYTKGQQATPHLGAPFHSSPLCLDPRSIHPTDPVLDLPPYSVSLRELTWCRRFCLLLRAHPVFVIYRTPRRHPDQLLQEATPSTPTFFCAGQPSLKWESSPRYFPDFLAFPSPESHAAVLLQHPSHPHHLSSRATSTATEWIHHLHFESHQTRDS